MNIEKRHQDSSIVSNSLIKRESEDEKQYKCGLCFNSFAQQDLLLQHLRSQHWSKTKIETKSLNLAPKLAQADERRSRVKIIKEEDILKNEQEMSKKMIFNTRMDIEVKQEPAIKNEEVVVKKLKSEADAKQIVIRPPLRKGKKRNMMVKEKEQILEELTRASTKKGKNNSESAEMTPVKMTERKKRSMRRSTPSSPNDKPKVTLLNLLLEQEEG
jgi:hypothetical protein